MRFRWALIGLCVFGAVASAVPAWSAPAPRTTTRTQIAQAVVSFGSCAVTVNVTEVTRRQLGRGGSTEGPAATLRVDHFCTDGMGSESRTLAAAEYGFGHDTAHVHASVGAWQVTFDWTATAAAQTFVLRSDTERTVMHDAIAAVVGSITDGVTTATGEATVMADVASLHTMQAAS